ncbi:MAG: hypothetical protein GX649_09605 [Chloroflexi bacterium]|nr:hypothetical protein [Chloroflexota bacterium]
MTIDRAKPSTVDEYIAGQPEELQEILQQIRAAIHEAAPGIREKISYGMPGFELNGDLIWFAAHKAHIGVYPRASTLAPFEEDLSAYKRSKGTIQFPLDRPIPYDLIRRITEYRVAENSGQGSDKSTAVGR